MLICGWIRETPWVVDMLTMDGDLLGFNLLLEFDVICLLGGVHINEDGEANFPNKVFSVGTADAVKIERPEFDVVFDPTEKKWTATWKWLGECPPKQLLNQTPEYTVLEHIQKDLQIANLDSQRMADTIPRERARSSERINPANGNCSA